MQLLLRPQYLLGIPSLFIGLSLVVLTGNLAVAAEVQEPSAQLTLQNALNLALNANPDIAVALREREATEGIKTQAGVRPNPTINCDTRYTQ